MLNNKLNYLIPYEVDELVRLGCKQDGGYVISKSSLENCSFLLSFGMAENWSFEEDFVKYNSSNEVHIYDHTVNINFFLVRLYKSVKRIFYFKSNLKNIIKKILDIKNYLYLKNIKIIHFKERVGKKNLSNSSDIKKIFSRIQKNSKIILKIDIEGDEFEILEELNSLSKLIHTLVIEFHYLDKKREKFEKIIKKINDNFFIIHLHGNNDTDYCEDGLPKTLEISFINKKYLFNAKKKIKCKLPIKNIDFPNIVHKKEIIMEFKD